MISLEIKGGDLIINDPEKELFNWNHRAFFQLSLGLEIDEEKYQYYISFQPPNHEIVREILDYLKEEDLSFKCDDQINHIQESIKVQNTEYQNAFNDLNKVIIPELKSFKRLLKPYQEKGLEHLLKVKHGANFSVPGSGKTTMVYAYYNELRNQGIVDKIFVVGPFSSFSPWEEESEKCFGVKLNSARLVGLKRQSYYFQTDEFELLLTHYQTAANDRSLIIDFLTKNKTLLIIDESHYIKRFAGGVWSEALLNIAPYAERRVILTGTPMPNGFIDLWSQMTFLWPGKQVLGERNYYKTRCDDVNQQEEIKHDIRPFFYRVKKADLDLPKPVTNKEYYDLNPIQAQIYNALSIRLLNDLNLQPLDRQRLKLWRKAKMVRLMQAASNPTLINHFSHEFDMPPLSAEGKSLIELIERYPKYEVPSKFEAAIKLARQLIAKGRKVLLWTTFVDNIHMLKSSLTDVQFYTIHGAVPKDENENEIFNRENEIRMFKNSKKPCLLIANPAACAESISLHEVCQDAIYLDRSFNCGQFIQSLDRIHRIGLRKDQIVNYYILIARNTIDETIDDRLNSKFNTMIHALEDELPIGDLELGNPDFENEDEVALDFSATVNDVKKFLKQ